MFINRTRPFGHGIFDACAAGPLNPGRQGIHTSPSPTWHPHHRGATSLCSTSCRHGFPQQRPDLPIDDEPAGIHAVVDGEHYSNGCCFNYGNASTNGLAVGTGTMESVYFGTSTGWGSGSGTGPWIMSDMEAGLFSGYNARVNEADPTIKWRFVTGVFAGGGRNFWELKGGNAQDGSLQTFYAGVRPGSKENSAYFPMHKKGAIQMGNGGRQWQWLGRHIIEWA